MGILDWLPCCGPRQKGDAAGAGANGGGDGSADPLLAPREGSLLSANDGGFGYGAVDGLGGESREREGMSKEQRRRIEEIGREVGSQMLSVHRPSPRHPRLVSGTSTTGGGAALSVPSSRQPSASHPVPAGAGAGASSPSASSSRRSSPSPHRPLTSPPGGTMRSARRRSAGSEGEGEGEGEEGKVAGADAADGEAHATRADGDGAGAGEGVAEGDEVVVKTVFMGGLGGGRGKVRGRGRGRGGKARGK